MIVNFHGMLCRYGIYRLMGENKPVLTLVDDNDWNKSLQYDFTEPQCGFWCHFLTDKELLHLMGETTDGDMERNQEKT